MQIDIEIEKVIQEKDIAKIIFTRQTTQRAARLFINWLAEKRGEATKYAISKFANELTSGKHLWHNSPFKYSRRNFYMTVIKRLQRLGLLGFASRYDERSRKTHLVYAYIHQNIPQSPPAGTPSFWRTCYYIASKWNGEFGRDEGGA